MIAILNTGLHVDPAAFPLTFQLRDEAGAGIWRAEVDGPCQLLVPSRKDLRLQVTTSDGGSVFEDRIDLAPVDWAIQDRPEGKS